MVSTCRPYDLDGSTIVTPPIGGSRSSSSSLDDRREFRELISGADEAR
jgi:hypothetical protein